MTGRIGFRSKIVQLEKLVNKINVVVHSANVSVSKELRKAFQVHRETVKIRANVVVISSFG